MKAHTESEPGAQRPDQPQAAKAHEHEHQHGHEHHHHHHHGSDSLAVAFWLNLVFTIIELTGGLLTNSISVLSDAVHDLGDSIALLFALIMEKLSRRRGNERLTFGFQRFNLLGALINALILVGGSIFVIQAALMRILEPQEVHAPGMLLMAVGGIIFNGIAVLRLRTSSGMNARVVFLHLLEDVLGWASILLISLVMMIWPLPVLDPLLSLAIAVFIMSRAIPTLMRLGRMFLQYRPDGHEIRKLRNMLESSSADVLEVHDLHLWTLDGTNHVFSCHAVLSPSLSLAEASTRVAAMKQLLAEQGIAHATIEAELPGSGCIACDSCPDG